MTFTASAPKRALLAGATCLLILSGMIVGHAWPLWTGRVVTMKVVPVDPRDLFRGEYVRLDTPAHRLYRQGAASASDVSSVVRPLDDVFEQAHSGAIVYVQLEPDATGDYGPVSVSRKPAGGALNLRGRVWHATKPNLLSVQFGLDAFYMREGKSRRVEQAIQQRRNVQMQIAIAASGQARIKTLLIDGVPVDRF